MKEAISLENVSKFYKIFPKGRDRLVEAASLGRVKRSREFWALKDVTLKVGKGVSLGLLGRNGAGKSTMLQLVAGVLQPTEGIVSTKGRISALLQLGAGFNPEFTGRENAMMNGLLLGIDRKEMHRRFDEIEEFADLGEFMDQPVKNYSSGMRSRLGFAVAVNVDPEILLVDEALSVGDGVFRHMGIQKMRDLQSSGATVIFVSHSTMQIKNFCTEAALIHKGRLVSHGPTSETVDLYEALLSNATASSDKDGFMEFLHQSDEEEMGAAPKFQKDSSLDKRRMRHGSGEVEVENVEILNERGLRTRTASPDSPMTVRVHLSFHEEVSGGTLKIMLRNRTGLDLFSATNRMDDAYFNDRKPGEKTIVDFTFIPALKHGPYSVAAGFSSEKDSYVDWINVAVTFEIDRPKDKYIYDGLAHFPIKVTIFEPDEISVNARDSERPA